VKKSILGTVLTAFVATLILAPLASARDFRVAGGIQYVIQGTKEKEKGNTEDARRIFGKAVTNLKMGIENDPKDSEAWLYLGQAYGELDSAQQCGEAFSQAVARITDPKIKKRAADNRDYFFNNAYNEGLKRYQDATKIMPAEEIPNSTDPKAAEAKAKLAEAAESFQKAVHINDSRAIAYDNLAIMLALQGKFDQAGPVVDAGLAKSEPKDGPEYERLKNRKDSLYNNAVVERLKNNDYDGALAMLDGILAKNPDDFGVLTRAAQTAFEKAKKADEAKDEAGAKAAYAQAAGYFRRAVAAAPDETNKKDMMYNQVVASQLGGDAKTAAAVAFDLVQLDPKDKSYHQLLRSAYDKMGAEAKAGEEVWVILGLGDTAVPVADLTAFLATVVKTSEAGKVLAANGPPDEVRQFTSGDTKVDVWFWWTKKLCAAFTGGRQVGTANFGEFAPDAPPPSTKPASKTGAAKK
jgi:tetratricopeptide (TPR) repeat protein